MKFLLILFLIVSCQSDDNSINEAFRKKLRETKNPVSEDVLNGMKWEEFENFYRDWHMVNSTYRTDRDQLRVVFANDIAWKALTEGGKSFPEGAMFAKMGFKVEEDQRFPSSKIPSDGIRLLLMKRNYALYPNTDGWGYALVNRREIELLKQGESPEKYSSITQFERSCHACHQLVKNTDFVFSRPMFSKTLGLFPPEAQGLNALINNFKKLDAPLSHKDVSDIFDKDKIKHKHADNLQYLEMRLFEGSLPELRAALTDFTRRNNQSYLVFDPTTKLYALSVPDNTVKNCQASQRYYTGCLDTTISQQNMIEVNRVVTICDGRNLTY